MASARPTSPTVRRRGSGARAADVTPVSPARWAGVALVVAALLGAIVLAVVSPGQRSTVPESELTAAGGAVAASPTPTPVASGTDTRLPSVAPTIRSPEHLTITREWRIDVQVAVPRDPELRRRQLRLVVLVDDKVAVELPRPQVGESVMVPDVELRPGPNVLTAALKGPGGLGPPSEPVTIHMDRDAPELSISSPEDGSTVLGTEVRLVIVSEPGASVTVRNVDRRNWKNRFDVGRGGTLETDVELRMGTNRIVVSSTGESGMKQEDQITVQAKSGKPVIELDVPAVKRNELPKRIRVAATVRDADGKAIEGAEVSFSMSSLELETKTSQASTDVDGRATWEVVVPAGAGDAAPMVSADVIATNDERATKSKAVKIS